MANTKENKKRMKFDPVTKKLQTGGILSSNNYGKVKKSGMNNILTTAGKGLFNIANEVLSSAEKGVNYASQWTAKELAKRTHGLSDNDLPNVQYEDHASTVQRMNPHKEIGLGEGLALNAVGDPLTFLSAGKIAQGYKAFKVAKAPKLFGKSTINLTHPKDVAKAKNLWNGVKKAETWGGLIGLGVDALDNGVVNKNQRGGVLNPTTWFTKDYTKSGNFNKAYGDAKRDGKESFMFKGKKFSTAYAGTPRQEVGKYAKGLSKEDLEKPSLVKLNPVFHHETLPGHISALSGKEVPYEVKNQEGSNIGSFTTKMAVDYRPEMNLSASFDDDSYLPDSEEGEKGMYIFNKKANDGIIKKSKFLEDKSDWCLLTNNCSDVVSDAFGLKRDDIVPTTPGATFKRLKTKYGNAAVNSEGRSPLDYQDRFNAEREAGADPLAKAEHWLGIVSSPEFKEHPLFRNNVAAGVQQALKKRGIDVRVDGIDGPKTRKALADFRSSEKERNSFIPISSLNPVLNIKPPQKNFPIQLKPTFTKQLK